eukprot:jgi/Mesvir1/13352/Mv16866-RA.1
MGMFMYDFKNLFKVGLLIGLAHVIATWVRVKREKFRLKANIRSTVSISWILGLSGLAYVLYRNFRDKAYAYDTLPWKIWKGFWTSGGASLSYSMLMTGGSAHFSSRPVAEVVEATVSEATAPTTAA